MSYENPVKRDGDFADPYVIRYNGRYYLYCTNRDIRCWSSVDLLNWKLEGPTIGPDEFPGLVPFAPEVTYWNGAFYMYTSPSGYGHYVLKSDLPTGPFHKITKNMEHSIDGTIFIDDDGQWYFYWADVSGILGCKMKSPTEFGEQVSTGAFMHGWTEGPFVLKRNGKYYMTYTGNHFLSSGYRINAAVSEHPLYGYEDDPSNPVLIRTEGGNVGLGHSCTVLGPDLKSSFLVYHNLNPDKSRDLNIDYQSWKGLCTQIYTSAGSRQEAPREPDFSDYAEDASEGRWRILRGTWHSRDSLYYTGSASFLCVTEEALEDRGVAEGNIRTTGNAGNYGMVFGWKNMHDYFKVSLLSGSKVIKLIKVEQEGECCMASGTLPDDYDETALHCLRMTCDSSAVILYLDNRRQLEAGIQEVKGRLGYFAEEGNIAAGFTGFSKGTSQEAEKEFYKPVPGEIPADTALNFAKSPLTAGGQLLYHDCKCPWYGTPCQDAHSASLRCGTMSAALYHVNIEESGKYVLDLFGAFSTATDWQITVDGTVVAKQHLPMKDNGIFSISAELPGGLHTVGLCLCKGQAELEYISFYKTSCAMPEGTRAITKFGPYGKLLWGEDGWSDYRITACLNAIEESENGQAGILLRTSQPSEGGEGDDPVLGINFFKGYFVGLTGTDVTLSRHSYDSHLLAEAGYEHKPGEAHRITVEAKGELLRIFIGDCNVPAIIYRDEAPFTHGRIGVRTQGTILEGTVTINGI